MNAVWRDDPVMNGDVNLWGARRELLGWVSPTTDGRWYAIAHTAGGRHVSEFFPTQSEAQDFVDLVAALES